MLLREARPEDLVRCGAVFGELAQEVERARSSASVSSQVVWTGLAGDAYQRELASLAQDLAAVREAYDAACDVLLRYVPRLEEARDEARAAFALTSAAQDQRVIALVSGGLLGSEAEAELARGASMDTRAEAAGSLAAGVAASALRDLAAGAPRSGAGANRFLSQAVRGFRDALVAPLELAVTGWGALPFVGSAKDRAGARQELVVQAEALAQPWTAVEQLLQQYRDGHGGEVLGSMAGMAVGHKFGVKAKDARLFGTHGGLDDAVMRAVRNLGTDVTGGAWILEREQRLLLEDLCRLEKVRLPTAQELLAGPVDLLHHEAHGGHAILKHVGRDEQFLRRRQDTFGGVGRPEVSAFTSLREAERAIAEVLADPRNKARLTTWELGGDANLELTLSMASAADAVVAGAQGATAVGSIVVVRFRRLASGESLITTAYVSSREWYS